MSPTSLVTVVTPVFNGEPYLAQCIESVLAQTYSHWEYVIVDNASTDRTGEIAQTYAARDSRLRVVRNERTVAVIANHNIAARQLSPESRWCKFLSADDVLFPECLERMLALAEAHPSIGLVCAYHLHGTRLTLGGLPYPSDLVPGREVARASLLGQLTVFGSPTAHMHRADLVRARDPFFDESNLHADEAACYETLRASDFGFVHQVLTYARVHPGSLTVRVARRLNTYLLGHLRILTTYGPVYFSAEEYARILEERLEVYYTYLARVLLAPNRRETWRFHRDGLRDLGLPVAPRRLVQAMLRQVARAALDPSAATRKVVRLVRASCEDDLSWRQWWAPTGFERVKSVRASRRPATARLPVRLP